MQERLRKEIQAKSAVGRVAREQEQSAADVTMNEVGRVPIVIVA